MRAGTLDQITFYLRIAWWDQQLTNPSFGIMDRKFPRNWIFEKNQSELSITGHFFGDRHDQVIWPRALCASAVTCHCGALSLGCSIRGVVSIELETLGHTLHPLGVTRVPGCRERFLGGSHGPVESACRRVGCC